MLPERRLSDRTRNSRACKEEISAGMAPSNLFMLSCSTWSLLKAPMVGGMEPVSKFCAQENPSRCVRLPRPGGMDPLTAPGEMDNCCKKVRSASSGGSGPHSPGSPASSGPRERRFTLLYPCTLTQLTPVKIWHGSIPGANSQLVKKLPPDRSAMAFFTALRTARSDGCKGGERFTTSWAWRNPMSIRVSARIKSMIMSCCRKPWICNLHDPADREPSPILPTPAASQLLAVVLEILFQALKAAAASWWNQVILKLWSCSRSADDQEIHFQLHVLLTEWSWSLNKNKL